MLVFDLETDGLLPELTKIHTIAILDINTNSLKSYDKVDVPKGLERLARADKICGHNIIDFDIPAIKKVYPEWETNAEVWDTLVWSRLLYPDIGDGDYARFREGVLPGQLIGRHSLEAWGYRLGEFKGEFAKETDWKYWSPEMSEYCRQDTVVTGLLHNHLLERTSPRVMREALSLEHQVQWIISRQIRYGWYFDIDKAMQLYERLSRERDEIHEQLLGIFGSFYVSEKEFTPKRKNRKMGYVEGATCTKIRQTQFNPGSARHVYWMFQKKYGWEPKEWTNTPGLPKVDEDVLESLSYPEAKLVKQYWTLEKRLGQLHDGKGSWVKFYNRQTGRIHGDVNPNGAVSGRMTHRRPHVTGVPANNAPYGKECRELWTVPTGKKLVGIDADALELRLLAHYLAIWDKGSYARAVTQGSKEDGTDAHTMNMKALGIDSRDTAKTWFYAWIYGAGDVTLGGYLGVGPRKAKQKNKEFLKRSPALAKLKKEIERKVRSKKSLIGLDGRRLKARALHSALNLLIQSAGGVVMKKALVILDRDLKDAGLTPGDDYEFVGNIHDEWQIECDPEHAEFIGKTGKRAIQKTTDYFKLNCPMDGNYDVGTSWAETH